jgi:hypothetical protein
MVPHWTAENNPFLPLLLTEKEEGLREKVAHPLNRPFVSRPQGSGGLQLNRNLR